MNIKLSNTVVGYLGLSSTFLLAGTSEDVTLSQEESKVSDLLSFSLDARARYEFRERDGSDASHAGTLRFRPGLTLFPKKDLSFFVESEHTFALLRDFQAGTGQSANFSPFNANNTDIADPENNELNQAYLKYKINKFASITAGRQRYNLDNTAFIGNVGWRQNEQTLDAISIKGSYNGFNYSYAIGDRVNRIFGNDGTGAVQALEGTFHLLNGSYKLDDTIKVGGYVYLMDFDQGGFASNNTYGAYTDIQTSTGNYYLELAYQTEAGDKADYDALYGHATWTKNFGSVSVKAGVEYLGDGFITPLGTVHAFNGFADAFIGNRLGLVNSWDGLTDFYVGASTKLNDVVLKGTVHSFYDDSLSDEYGWEVDMVAIKPINESTKILAKAAYFISEDNSPFSNDIKQFSIQLDYSF